MTFAELALQVRQSVHPEGTAENLIRNHENYIRDALIEIQRRIPSYRIGHRTEFPQPVTMFKCGSTIINLKDAGIRGFLMALWTQTSADGCDRVDYSPIGSDLMRCLLRDQWNCGTRYGAESSLDQYYLPDEDLLYADDSTDKACRARVGVWTLDGDELIVYPHIQSDESVVLEWAGLKRSWKDYDVIPSEIPWVDESGELDRDVEDAIELYLTQKTARKDDEDYDEYGVVNGEFNVKLSTLIWQFKKERQLPDRRACFSNCANGASLPGVSLGLATPSSETETDTDPTTGSRCVATVADMRSITNYEDGVCYVLLGNTFRGDGGGGLFFFTLTAIDGSPMLDADDNGGTTVKPNDLTDLQPGRFKRI